MSDIEFRVTDDERYLFDLTGFLVIKDALEPDHLRSLNNLIDTRLAAADPGAAAVKFGDGQILDWGQPIIDLIDNPRILPYLEEFVDPNFRLDHEYIHVLRPEAGSLTGKLSSALLHGGGSPFDSSQYYAFRGGRPWNGLTVVAYNLKDVLPGDGGFACIPGSHKANYKIPDHFLTLDGDLPWFVVPITGPAGSAIIFSEAQTHGTLPWLAKEERRTIFFKYSPHAVSWHWSYHDPHQYELTERQRAILEPPNGRSANRQPVSA